MQTYTQNQQTETTTTIKKHTYLKRSNILKDYRDHSHSRIKSLSLIVLNGTIAEASFIPPSLSTLLVLSI